MMTNKYAWAVLTFFSIIIFFTVFQVSSYRIQGTSMSPSLNNNDTIYVWKARKYNVGQIVVFQAPAGWQQSFTPGSNLLVKRIKAVAGDKVSFDGSTFYVNDERIAYSPNCQREPTTFVVPKDQVLAVGDNRSESVDSLEAFCKLGGNFFVPASLIEAHGKIIYHQQ